MLSYILFVISWMTGLNWSFFKLTTCNSFSRVPGILVFHCIFLLFWSCLIACFFYSHVFSWVKLRVSCFCFWFCIILVISPNLQNTHKVFKPNITISTDTLKILHEYLNAMTVLSYHKPHVIAYLIRLWNKWSYYG